MAIRPAKCINELNVNEFKQVFKSAREIGTGQIFSNLFVAGMEHILVYKKGFRLEEFIQTVFSMIKKEELDPLREAFNDVFEDLEELMQKKQMKILSSMIYDCNFSSVLTNIAEMIEIPINKSSMNESFNEICFLSENLKINSKILNGKMNETKFVKEDGIVSVYLFEDKGKFWILAPLEYKEFYIGSSEEGNHLYDPEEDMRKINVFDLDGTLLTRSLSDAAGGVWKRNLSPGEIKDDKEERMRSRAKALKMKREQKRIEEHLKKVEDERMEEVRMKELEEARMQKEMEELEKMRDRIKLEEENKQLKEWKLSEDLKKSHNKSQLLKDIESNTFNPDYLPEDVIQVIESLHRTEEEKLHEERKQIEEQKKELFELLHQKEKLYKNIKLYEQKMQEEEQKLIEDKVMHELKKQELEQVITAEREEFLQKLKQEEQRLKLEKEKLELMRIEELKKLEEEKRKIEHRRLEEDKKIAEKKRLAAESKLREMKKIIEDLKPRPSTPKFLNSSFSSFAAKASEAVSHTEATQQKIQNIIDSIEKNHKKNSSHCPTISQFSPQESEPSDPKALKSKPAQPPDLNFLKNYTKFKNRVKLSQSSPDSSPINTSSSPNPPNISLKSLNSVSSLSSSPNLNSKPKPESWLDHQKKLIESRKLEVGKILEKNKKIEFTRDSGRRKTEDQSVLEESKRLLETKRRNKEGRFTSFDRQVQDFSPVERRSKATGSVLGFGFFDEIFNKDLNVSEPAADDFVNEIEDFKLKHLNEDRVEDLPNETTGFVIKLEPVTMTEEFKEVDEGGFKEGEKIEIVESIEENLGTCDHKSICGGVYCVACIKDLKKSSLYLRCNSCCLQFINSDENSSKKSVLPSKKQICMKCSNKVVKGEEVWCFCCFIQLKIQKKALTYCENCQKPDKLSWLDACLGDSLVLCSFCGENRDKNCVLEICGKCQEMICFVCLRKNPYVASSICSTCLNRRQVKVHV